MAAHPKCRVLESGKCTVTQPYHINGQKGYNYDHWGIDLVDWNGSYNVLGWIVAHTAGTVVGVRNNCTGFESGSYGNYVLLQHANGYSTMYAHMSYGTVQVKVGQTVKKGQRLGYMGNTGESYGGHLHWEVRLPNGYKTDPEPFLNADLPNSNKLTVDGKWGKKTTKAAQKVYKTTVDGIVSNQPKSCKKYCTNCLTESWQWNSKKGGSPLIKAIQKACGVEKVTGRCGQITIKALQKALGVTQDGYMGKKTVTAFQKWLNKRL